MDATEGYEARLLAEIEHVEGQAEGAFQALWATDAHPLSDDYKMLSRIALINAGTLSGLLQARHLLTGEKYDQEFGDKLEGWMQR